MLRVLFVANPAAGRSKAAPLEKIVDALKQRGTQAEVYWTQGVADATRMLQNQTERYDTVVAVGGDGTVNEVINGLRGRPESLAVIPAGTTNVLATELALPTKVDQIVTMLLANKTIPIYLGDVNGRRFSMMTGIGYDAWVCAGVDIKLKKTLGKLTYVMSMLRNIVQYGRQQYNVEIDGRLYQAASMVITNGRHYAGKFLFSRVADLRQPSLQVVLLQSSSRWALLGMLLAMVVGRVESLSFMAPIAGKQIRVSAQDGAREPVQADGDVVSRLPAEIQIEPHPVKVVVR